MRVITLLTAGCALTLGLWACTNDQNPAEPSSSTSLSRGEVSTCGVDSESYICVRYKNGDSVDINPHGYDDITVAAMNPAGEIAGTYGAGGLFHAFLWSEGVFSSLPELDPGTSHATDINPRGQVVGYSDTQSGYHAVLWEKGVVTDLGTLGGCCSMAADIDPSGRVFGVSYTVEGERHAFVWKNGVMTDLGPA
jgi:probable HAF family extracellular repeat protein